MPRRDRTEGVVCRPRDRRTGAWETATLEEHAALLKRQVDRSLEDPELVSLAKRIAAGKPDAGRRHQGQTTIAAWGNRYVMPLCDAPALTELEEARLISTRIWNFVVSNWTYIQDPPSFDHFSTARYGLDARASADLLEKELHKETNAQVRAEVLRYIAELRSVKTLGAEDCFPEGTLLLRDDYELVPVEHLRVGDRIWGAKEWTVVEKVWPKGAKPLTAIRLNNGSNLRLTEDHKVYVVTCPRHIRANSPPCACPEDACQIERIRVADVQPGMRLAQPERIAFGVDTDSDPERHYVEGLYLADGWASEDYRFFISGKDGAPKEQQKHDVQAIAHRLGLETRWHPKYLAVNDPIWTRERMALMGRHAPQKRAISLNLGEVQARELLRGIMADGTADGATFTSTSRTLATQVRVLHRMFGTPCGSAFITDHGGLGKHPIHRLYIRNSVKGSKKILRVKDVVRGLPEEPTWDIQTADHKVYLPEHDVVVSNCDGVTIILVSLHKAAGFRNCRARIISTDEEYWEHVYTMIGLPMTQSRVLWPLDPTVRAAVPGWEYPRAKAVHDFIL